MVNPNKEISLEPTAIKVWVEARKIFVELTDGRIVAGNFQLS